ncbi:hypothetical protein METH_16945 [Leisingera methylohalidivorans DSM 14336]|uniref:Uncharacterized protein n=1 Tax=Leisingera methylohalidivorans DSM 14336 TaxID=999552 RepID=V9VZ52_9RHOB|nr:hypothetical protein METH_16945 [Leisingera methylohalidivorans DSM 14336]
MTCQLDHVGGWAIFVSTPQRHSPLCGPVLDQHAAHAAVQNLHLAVDMAQLVRLLDSGRDSSSISAAQQISQARTSKATLRG